jgi:hypothetical protein
LSLVLLSDDSGADVEDCRLSNSSNCVLASTSKLIGDPVLDDVGPRVDSQLGLGVLLPV